LATSLRQVRWSELDEQGRAKQFANRGIERTARNEIRSVCEFCGNSITEGNKYSDINGAKYAHETCVATRVNACLKARTNAA